MVGRGWRPAGLHAKACRVARGARHDWLFQAQISSRLLAAGNTEVCSFLVYTPGCCMATVWSVGRLQSEQKERRVLQLPSRRSRGE